KVLFVGRFDQNKNVISLIQALLYLKEHIPDLNMSLVDGDVNIEDKVAEIIRRVDWNNFYGPVHDRSTLSEILLSHRILAMPSIHETFGLVYIEALSQGLPVLYSKGQGIDGVFNSTVGEAVNPHSVNDIQNKLKKMITSPHGY